MKPLKLGDRVLLSLVDLELKAGPALRFRPFALKFYCWLGRPCLGLPYIHFL